MATSGRVRCPHLSCQHGQHKERPRRHQQHGLLLAIRGIHVIHLIDGCGPEVANAVLPDRLHDGGGGQSSSNDGELHVCCDLVSAVRIRGLLVEERSAAAAASELPFALSCHEMKCKCTHN